MAICNAFTCPDKLESFSLQFEEDHSAQNEQTHDRERIRDFMFPVIWTIFTFVLGLIYLTIAPHKVRSCCDDVQ